MWVADITYVWTVQGWYLAVILDLFSRRVVGWSMAEHMRVDLVLGALEAALGKRVPSAAGLVFHSDRGSQYAAKDYRAALEAAGITCSMSRRGNYWDNTVAESFFATLKTSRRVFRRAKEQAGCSRFRSDKGRPNPAGRCWCRSRRSG